MLTLKGSERFGVEKGVRMRTLRMLVLMLLVMMATILPIATSAYASGFDAAEDFAYYLYQYYWEGW